MLRRAAAALALAALLACGAEAPEGPPPPAPAFSLPDLEGEPVALADYAGRIVLVDFWATWCEPCIHQIPVLNAFAREQGPDGVAVLGVSVDAGGREAIESFRAEHDIDFAYPVLLGSERLARAYGVPGFPALAVVDADGGLVGLHLGVVTPEELAEAVAEAGGR